MNIENQESPTKPKTRRRAYLLRFVSLPLIIAVSSCAERVEKCTSEDEKHEWGKWEDVWTKPNDAGNMRQARSCDKCGVAQVNTHH